MRRKGGSGGREYRTSRSTRSTHSTRPGAVCHGFLASPRQERFAIPVKKPNRFPVASLETPPCTYNQPRPHPEVPNGARSSEWGRPVSHCGEAPGRFMGRETAGNRQSWVGGVSRFPSAHPAPALHTIWESSPLAPFPGQPGPRSRSKSRSRKIGPARSPTAGHWPVARDTPRLARRDAVLPPPLPRATKEKGCESWRSARQVPARKLVSEVACPESLEFPELPEFVHGAGEPVSVTREPNCPVASPVASRFPTAEPARRPADTLPVAEAVDDEWK